MNIDAEFAMDSKEIDQWIPCSMPNYEPGHINLFYGQGKLRLVVNYDTSLLYPEVSENHS